MWYVVRLAGYDSSEKMFLLTFHDAMPSFVVVLETYTPLNNYLYPYFSILNIELYPLFSVV
jgi:hypothetical protein